jgi:CRP/FNR family cyclic AMP-dependent transcriptional regulator
MSGPPPEDAPGAEMRTLELFAGVPAAVVDRALAGLPARRLAQEEEIDLGEAAAACCVVQEGRLALQVAAPDGRARIIGLVEQGDVLVPPVDSWAAVGPRPRPVAIEDSALVLVSAERLEDWLREPALAANVTRILSRQIADRELAVAIALEPRVERRLLLKLGQLAERFGVVTPEGIRLDLRLTHRELAQMVGTARESVTLALGRLADAGEIEVRNRTLVVRRPVGED